MYQVRTHLVKYQVPTYHLTLTLTLPYPNQAGTLSGNPLAMMAGIKTLEILKQPGTYKQLDEKTGKLINGILDAGKAAGHAVCGGHISGMFGFFFCEGPIKCALNIYFLPLADIISSHPLTQSPTLLLPHTQL